MLKEFFNAAADHWDEMMGPAVITKLREIVQASRLKPGAKVLDVACGTGILGPLLLEAVGETGAVVAIDFAPAMIKQAQAKRMAGNIQFMVADVMALPFTNADFDVVFCNAALPHFPDIPAALAEMARVLVPDGLLVISHASSRDHINQKHLELGEPVCHDLLPPATELIAYLVQAGFRVTEIEDNDDRFVIRARKQ